ncbi:unnamed protein product [Caenorhabditis angaria]|uniref:Uncharacterized protein n=1 Tax=Caenorhabditis angaria TaxID=860376 RepID=A0A9P1I5T1_9PELO|nr:unnamed protein product [Caenorhabditis angaria]
MLIMIRFFYHISTISMISQSQKLVKLEKFDWKWISDSISTTIFLVEKCNLLTLNLAGNLEKDNIFSIIKIWNSLKYGGIQIEQLHIIY